MKLTRRGIITFIAVAMFAALVLFASYVVFIGIQIAHGFKEIASKGGSEASVSDYSAIRDRWLASGLVNHFPEAIPDDAKDARLYYHSAFLQRGAVFQVRFSMQSNAIAKIYESAVVQKTRSFQGGDMTTHGFSSGGLPTTLFWTSSTKPTNDWSKFPVDYEVMSFDPIPTNKTSSSHWKSHGVAISRSRNEVVYWAEDW